MTRIYNKKSEEQKRRSLRNNPTLAEKVLWMSLRKKQLNGIRFLRQYSVNQYVMDFYAPEIKLAIEVDGDSHIGKEEYDRRREKYIQSFNIKIIRFKNERVLWNVEKVVKEIEKNITERKEICSAN